MLTAVVIEVTNALVGGFDNRRCLYLDFWYKGTVRKLYWGPL